MRFHDLKLRTKLILLVTGVSAAAVVLLGTHVAGMLWFYQREDVARTALAQADLVAQGTAAALAFDDPRAARENLSMFRAQPTVAGAAVYDRSGDLFAGYVRKGSPVPVPHPLPETITEVPEEGFTTFVGDQVVAVVPVRLQGEALGSVGVVADLSEAYHTLLTMARVAGIAIVVSLLLAVVLSIRLQRLVSGPILELADLTGRVSRERNYALRAPAGGRDELGLLAGNFNAMLGEIQTRDEALRRHREGLERTVAERTRELGRANARLTDELGERRRAEALVRGQNEALESLATGRPLADTLVVLCHFLEDQIGGTRCAVMAHVPESGRMAHLAGPQLPPDYLAALDAWPAGPAGLPVPIKPDTVHPLWTRSIAESPLWEAVRPLALSHGLQACWCMPVRSPEGAILGRICLYHDAPIGEPTDPQRRLLEIAAAIAGMAMERDRSEAALRQAATVFESTLEAVVILDDRGRIVAVNRAFTEITGFPAEDVLGTGPTGLSFSAEGDDGRVWEALQGAGHWQDEVRGVRRDGTPFPAWLTVNTVRGPDRRVTRYVALFTDITERKLAEERLARMALFDGLTGLANRRLFTDRLSQALGRARRQKGQVAVLFVDLDRFKPVNDSLGHAAGDEVLKAVSERVKGVLRQEDTLARLGGDEFTVILEDITGREDAVRVAERLLEAVSAPLDLDGQEVAVGASIGISIYPDDGADAAALVGSADMAMYRAKEAGRGVFCFFAGEMQDRVALRLRMDAALRHAMERREFRLVFQPQVEVRSGRLVGAEALLRWRNPELGDVAPDTFVPILEDTGLIFPVGEWVLAEACRQWHAWATAGAGTLRVAVNLSGRQLHRERLPELVRRALGDTGLPPACLELELTESVVMEDAPATVETLNALQDLGVSLAVDDFGTGYSSLSYLKAFPIRALKIDRSFVRDINVDEGDRAIAGAVISLAHSLDLNVVAEGVETEDQLAVLRGLDCDLAQGYLFGRPMEAEAFRRHLGERVAPRPANTCLPTPP